MEILYLIPFLILILITISMIIQGWMIMNARYGYSKNPKIKHPEMNDVKSGDPLLVIKFTEEDLKQLRQRVNQQKMEELFEEPSSYEDEDEDEEDDDQTLIGA